MYSNSSQKEFTGTILRRIMSVINYQIIDFIDNIIYNNLIYNETFKMHFNLTFLIALFSVHFSAIKQQVCLVLRVCEQWSSPGMHPRFQAAL